MRNRFEWFLIAGGLLWIALWTAHTIAHGPLNPAPETGRFLGRSSLFYATWSMFLSPVTLSVGWAGLHRYAQGRWKVARTAGSLVGFAGLLVTFIAGCCGMFAIFRDGAANADYGSVWTINAVGQLLLLAGTLVFGIGFARVSNFNRILRFIPLTVALLIPLISYLRQPGSPLLDMGPTIGYVLLESLGALFGICWIVLGIAVWRFRE